MENGSDLSLDFESHKGVIKKNAFWLFSGQLIGRLVRTGIIIYAARVLGVVSWGAFSYALSLATLLTVLSDLGMNGLLTREATKNPTARKKYLSTIFFIKFGLLLCVGSAFLIFARKFNGVEEVEALIPIMAAIVIFDSLRDLGMAIARALEKMEIEGANNILTNAAIAIFGFALLYLQPTSVNVSLGYALGTLAGLISIWFSLRHEIGEIFKHFDKSLIKPIMWAAIPFGLVGLMATIMINTDIFMIGYLATIHDVGLYSAPQKIVQLLYIFPVLIAATFFPMLTRSAGYLDKFRKNFETALTAVFMIGFPIAVGAIILAKPIIEILYGVEYLGSVNAFIILALTILLVFPSVLISNGIFAHDKQKNLLYFALLGIFGNLVLDFLLIPVWGIEGAALATLINQALIGAYIWYAMKRIAYFQIMGKLYKIIIATLAMGITAHFLNEFGLNVIINIVVSGLAYFSLLVLLRDESVSVLIRSGGVD